MMIKNAFGSFSHLCLNCLVLSATALSLIAVSASADWDVPATADSAPLTLEVFDDTLYVGGYFHEIGDVSSNHVASFAGGNWTAYPGHPTSQYSFAVTGLTKWDGVLRASSYRGLHAWNGEKWVLDSTAPGNVSESIEYQGVRLIGRPTANNQPGLYEWTGSSWKRFSGGDVLGSVHSMAVLNDELYVGGDIVKAGDIWVRNIARFDGTSWHNMGAGVAGGQVIDLTVFDNELIVCGNYNTAGPIAVNGVATWNGSSWGVLRGGLTKPGSVPIAYVVETYKGSLILGGNFDTVAGITGSNIARWDGTGWSSLGSGVNSTVYDIAEYQGWLWAVGTFREAGGQPGRFIARWNDAPVPVTISGPVVAWEGTSAVLRWRILGNPQHAGFHVYRSIGSTERVRLTNQLLIGTSRYEFKDENPPAVGADYWLSEISRTGIETWHGPATLPPMDLESRLFLLAPNYPNPFRAQTTLSFRTRTDGSVVLKIFDLAGREVARPVDTTIPAGEHKSSWNGTDSAGRELPAGMYLLRLEAPDGVKSRKIVKMK